MSSQGKQSILITGATAGIGRHAALHFTRKGHHVIATGRRPDALEKLRAEAAGASGKLDPLVLDVTNGSSIAAAAEAALGLTEGRGIDALINNAGYGLGGPLEELSDQDLRAQFETNVFGLLAVTRAFLPQLRARGGGRILNLSSVGGRFTFPLFGAYHATKYAVEAISDAMRNELRPFGIHVVLIEPGVIKTEFAERSVALVKRYERSDSPYASVYARADELKAQTDRQAVGPEVIARAMERALAARRPAARYMAPFRARILLVLLRLLPTRLTDALLRAATGLTRKRLTTSGAKQQPPNTAAAAR